MDQSYASAIGYGMIGATVAGFLGYKAVYHFTSHQEVTKCSSKVTAFILKKFEQSPHVVTMVFEDLYWL